MNASAGSFSPKHASTLHALLNPGYRLGKPVS